MLQLKQAVNARSFGFAYITLHPYSRPPNHPPIITRINPSPKVESNQDSKSSNLSICRINHPHHIANPRFILNRKTNNAAIRRLRYPSANLSGQSGLTNGLDPAPEREGRFTALHSSPSSIASSPNSSQRQSAASSTTTTTITTNHHHPSCIQHLIRSQPH